MIQTNPQSEEGMDLYGHLVRNRIIFLGSRITTQVATKVVAQLLALEVLDADKDIKFYINSAGGHPYSIMAILDAMEHVKPDISTIAMGQCTTTAALLLAAGTKGKRFSLPNARIMMHQPVGGAEGSSDEVNIQATEMNRTLKVINQFFAKYTGLPPERIEEETDRENYLNPQQAMQLGLIDAVI